MYLTSMETHDLNRFSPLKLSGGRALRNRVVVPPMASQTADEQGFVTRETLTHYQRLAEARPGLLFVEYTYVHSTGRSEDHQLGVQSDMHIEGLRQLARVIQQTGALAGLQITHSGGKTERGLTGGRLMGASRIAVPVKAQEMEIPEPMTTLEIVEWRKSFVSAVDRAVQAGFDVVEFHSAHGYGLNQWLSPITNQRDDEYGQNLFGRMKLQLEIVAEVRLRHPRLLLSVRMPGQDFLEGGLQIQDTILLARVLESMGVNFIHVSSGIGGWRRPTPRTGEGYLVAEAEKIQAEVKVPVIGVGGIETGEYIDESLQRGRFQLAAVGRAILKDPVGWANQNGLAERAQISFIGT